MKGIILFTFALWLIFDWGKNCWKPQGAEAKWITCTKANVQADCQWLIDNGFEITDKFQVPADMVEACANSIIKGKWLASCATNGATGESP